MRVCVCVLVHFLRLPALVGTYIISDVFEFVKFPQLFKGIRSQCEKFTAFIIY